jgi:hypothetical protein
VTHRVGALVALVAVLGAAACAVDGSATAPQAPVPPPPVRTQPPAPIDDADRLAAQVAADRATAEGAVGSWLPQVSSKVAGLEVAGVVYDDGRILREFRAARDRFGAILVRSGDYSSFGRSGLWVTLVPQRFTDAEAANGWCDAQGFAADDCFAKRLSHTDGPQGSTRHR